MKITTTLKGIAALLLAALTFAASGDSGAQEAEPAPTAAAAETGDEQLEEFEPSEEVPADEAISFPVDI